MKNFELMFKAFRVDGVGWASGFVFKTPLTADFSCDGEFFDSGCHGRWCIVDIGGCVYEVHRDTVKREPPPIEYSEDIMSEDLSELR